MLKNSLLGAVPQSVERINHGGGTVKRERIGQHEARVDGGLHRDALELLATDEVGDGLIDVGFGEQGKGRGGLLVHGDSNLRRLVVRRHQIGTYISRDEPKVAQEACKSYDKIL